MIKKILQKITWYLWLAPFISFLGGYWICYLWVQKTELTVPNIIGKSAYQAIVLLSEKRLSMRVRSVREDATLPEGVILDQLPKSGQLMRVNQNIYVTLSQKPLSFALPDFCGATAQNIQAICHKQGLDLSMHSIPSYQITGKCLAQYPQAGELVHHKKMLILIAAQQDDPCLVPRLKGLPVVQVKRSLKQENVVIEIFHEQVDVDHTCNDCVVVSQQPAAGTIVKTSERLVLQLSVKDS
jgi:beta-lactam-binding protein with PASTA domain